VDPAFWGGRRVLLTGHTGFKGAWLALWLTGLGARVTGYAGPPPSEPSLFSLAGVDGVVEESVVGDVRDAAHVRAVVDRVRPEVVLHLAAQPIVRRSLVDPAETWDTNVLGTVQVLEAVRGCGEVRAVVVVTSDKCYRDVDAGRPLTEGDPLGGKDPYSASKAAQEIVVAAHRATILAERGVAVATARAGNVIGGGDWGADRLVPDLFRAALAGEPLVLRNPAAIRPWQHVANPLAGYLRLARALHESGPGNGIDDAWNFGPAADDEQPVAWLVERLRARWPREIVVEVRPDPDAKKESPVLRLDSSRAREQLGWSPRWDIEQGLDRTAEWFAAHARGADMLALTREQIAEYRA
jgi:CDP-glucose 4,6-dehydratase